MKWLAIWHNGENVLTETDTERQARTGLSSNDMADQAAAAVQKTPNRVSIESIRAKITCTELIHPESAPHMTIAVITMDNGFFLVGKSTPADPANFDAALGEKFAIEDAERHAWPLEAYLLREKMTTRPDETVSAAAGTAGEPAGAQAVGANPVG